MDNAQVALNIRNIAKRLLSEGVVDCVIGFEKGTVPMRDRPFFRLHPGRRRKAHMVPFLL